MSSFHLVLSGFLCLWIFSKRRRSRVSRLGSILLLLCSGWLLLLAHEDDVSDSASLGVENNENVLDPLSSTEEQQQNSRTNSGASSTRRRLEEGVDDGRSTTTTTTQQTFQELWEHFWGTLNRNTGSKGYHEEIQRAAALRGDDGSATEQKDSKSPPLQQRSQWSQQQQSSTAKNQATSTSSPLHPVHHPATRKRRNWLLAHALHHFYSQQVVQQTEQLRNETNFETLQKQVVDVYQGVFDFFLHRHAPHHKDESSDGESQQHHHESPSDHHHHHYRGDALPSFPQGRSRENRRLIREMFTHAYDSYMIHGFYANATCTGETCGPSISGKAAAWGEVRPLSCQPHQFDLVEIPALTLLDSVDTLLLLGNATEFARATERLRALDGEMGDLFAIDQNVSVFETTIRVLGSCLSAHQLALAFLESSETTPPKLHPPRLDDVFDRQGGVRWGYSKQEPEDTATSSTSWTSSTTTATSTSSPQHIETEDPEPATTVAHEEASLLNHWSCPASVEHGEGAPPLYIASSSPCSDECPLRDSPKNTTKSKTTSTTSIFWQYDGFYLELARDLGQRLLPAFATETGIPYGTVNLLTGVPLGETTVASLAGGGTLVLEFELLSRLTGDPSFGQPAQLAARALWHRRSRRNQLLGKHIDIQRGLWTESLSGVGSNSDSYLEYLVKAYTLFPEDDDYWIMAQSVYTGLHEEARTGDWYVDVDMHHGQRHSSRRVFESLMAFYPGMQVLLGEITPAARTLNSFLLVREVLGFLPERFHFGSWTVDSNGISGASKHPLRPELLESCYFLHRATKDLRASPNSTRNVSVSSSSAWMWAADFALYRLASASKAPCGYASVKDLRPATSGSLDGSNTGIKFYDEMPSFFLSETLKYLYLTFDEDNLLHQDTEHEWIFTTEAHPIHYVPKVKGNTGSRSDDTDEFAEEKEMVMSMLRVKLKGHRPRYPPRTADELGDKWTETINRDSYRMDIQDFQATANQNRTASPSQATDTLVDLVEYGVIMPRPRRERRPPVIDTFNETRNSGNIAHLSFADLGMGPGTHLRKACPNLHSSDLLWMHAVNGGSTDYTDSFLSKMADDMYIGLDDYALLGAAEALGLLGTGLYVGRPAKTEGCSVSVPEEEKDATVSTPEDIGEVATEFPAEDEIEIDSDFGKFEISVFPNGGGFYLRHVDSGETTVTTFFADGDDASSDKVLLMSYSTNPDQGSGLDEEEEDISASLPLVETHQASEGATDEAPPTGKQRETTRGVSSDRTLVVADFEQNSFTCEIEILQILKGGIEERVNVVPCAHGLFGQTQMSTLTDSNGVDVQGTLVAPREGNEHGCAPLEDRCMAENIDLPTLEGDARAQTTPSSCRGDESIPVVRRGRCSFFDKSSTQRSLPAVIVINSEEDELFVMSTGPDEGTDLDLPVTVLVTSADGEDLLNSAGASVRIRIQRQRVPTAKSETSDLFQWPIVRGSPDQLLLFGRSGWGVQAQQAEDQWQLQLFQHAAGSGQPDDVQ